MRTIIYSTLVRLWGNKKAHAQLTPYGTLEQNGTGTLEDFDDAALDYLASLGVSHLWSIGIIRHATQTPLSGWTDCPDQHPDIVKGQAGSPYAITDYYDVHPVSYTHLDVYKRQEWLYRGSRTRDTSWLGRGL